MKSIPFYIVDVFAQNKYQGNQLAVFLDCGGLSTEQMQQIANETHFAETTFIVSGKKENGGYDVRIFTPDTEVPFAGHPTLGTAYILQKKMEKDSSERILLNLGVGQIPVAFEVGGDLWMKQNQPQFGPMFDKGVLAKILSIPSDAIDGSYPLKAVSTGLASVIVPLSSLDAVKACHINHSLYRAFLDETYKANLLVFCRETYHKENTLHVRVFCDDTGFPEDAATGSANGNLAGYLLECDYFGKKEMNYCVEQGYSIKRPSLVKVKAGKEGALYAIYVGGQVFQIAKGEWEI